MTGVNEKKYVLISIGNTITVYLSLAYYYVSWAEAFPKMLYEIKLPFDKKYAIAKTFNAIKKRYQLIRYKNEEFNNNKY